MTREVLKAINAVSRKVNELAQRLDEYHGKRYEENAENIDVNSGGIDDLAETTDVSASALDELAEYVAALEEDTREYFTELEERIAKVEGKNTESEE